MTVSCNDIYEYHFANLFKQVKNLIGRSAVTFYATDADEQEGTELDEHIEESNLLFDVSGNDFKWLKACDSEFKYWVEVYIVKIIKNLFDRAGKHYVEKYHYGSNEQHSIVYESDGRQIEAYFLFDVEYEESTRTDYDKIANALKANSQGVDKINLYIFRDRISQTTLAWLINGNDERSANGLVEVLPLHCFFEENFGEKEYTSFLEYSNDFHAKCNRIISYKTVIAPTQRTLAAFKQKKCQMLRDKDYLEISSKGQSGELSKEDFEKVKESFLRNKMYTAMVSSNDFADSFVSAEWAYDVYSHSMGELELTGIIAGYLKSIEQLMYTIARFHRDQGIKIKTTAGFQPYTKDNEQIIDSTLWSLTDFITSPKGKLALSASIRGCIHKAVNLWRQYQRNGYFHKDNLYLIDNKIDDVRELTIYLYFLILGGISFSSEEMKLLGVLDTSNKSVAVFDEARVYPQFKKWIENIMKYDLPESIPGIWILMTYDRGTWEVHPYLMRYFYIDEFESSSMKFDPEQIELNHIRKIPSFKWEDVNANRVRASSCLQLLLDRYKNEPDNKMTRIQAIVSGLDREMQLIYFKMQD